MEEIVTLVSNVGFPIVCCVVLMKNNEKFSEVLTDISKTLEVMKNEISDLKNKSGGDTH